MLSTLLKLVKLLLLQSTSAVYAEDRWHCLGIALSERWINEARLRSNPAVLKWTAPLMEEGKTSFYPLSPTSHNTHSWNVLSREIKPHSDTHTHSRTSVPLRR